MNTSSPLVTTYRELIAAFVQKADTIDTETDPRPGLSELFLDALEIRERLLEIQGVDADVLTATRVVANDINQKSTRRAVISSEIGRPNWHMDSNTELFNWITENRDRSVTVDAISSGLATFGIEWLPANSREVA